MPIQEIVCNKITINKKENTKREEARTKVKESQKGKRKECYVYTCTNKNHMRANMFYKM